MSVSLNEGLERLLDNNTCEEQKRKQKKLFKEESVGEDVARYQKWVDYDMKRYGEVSEKTKDSLEKAGLSLVKDQYGEYEVIADEKIHESCNCKKRFLKEGTSNFYSMSNFPLLIFGDDEDVYDRVWDMTKEELGGKVDDDEIDQTEEFENNWKTYFDYCTLSPEEQSELQDELKEINDKLETLRYTKEDELESDFEIAKIEIRPGYYEALQLFVPDEKYLEDWQIDAINDALEGLKKEYGLTELGVSWRASNGETGYSKLESLEDTLGVDYRSIELEDDDSETGGIAFAGETLGDFLDDSEEDFKDLDSLNSELASCGIKKLERRNSKLESLESLEFNGEPVRVNGKHASSIKFSGKPVRVRIYYSNMFGICEEQYTYDNYVRNREAIHKELFKSDDDPMDLDVQFFDKDGYLVGKYMVDSPSLNRLESCDDTITEMTIENKHRNENLKKAKSLNEAKLVDRKTFGGIHNIFGHKVWVTGELSDTRDYRWEDVRIEDASGDLLGFGRYKWLNRPWQRFTYDVAFTKAVRDAFGDTAAKKADEAVENSSSIDGALKWLEEHEEKDECLTEDTVEYAIWVKDGDDNKWKMWGGNSDPELFHGTDKESFLKRINHRKFPNYTAESNYIDAKIVKGGEPVEECANLKENVTVYRVVDDNTGDTMDFENRRDAVDFARKKGLYAVKVTLNDEGDVVNESVISDRIRKGDLDYEDEVDAYSVKDGDTYVQFQDRETRETRLKGEKDKWGNLRITGREDRQPRVSSHTIARIWKKDKDGKVTFDRVEGPKYLVRQDVARMFDKDESLTEADVTDQVIIDTHKDGFLTKKAELRDKGYKTLWVGNGKICMYKPKEAVTEEFEIGDYVDAARLAKGHGYVFDKNVSPMKVVDKDDKYYHLATFGTDRGRLLVSKDDRFQLRKNKFTEAHKEQADEDAVSELVLYAENDSRIYRNKTLPVIANLKRKASKGVFDKELAVKAFQYVADDAAKQYKKEFPAEDDGTYDYNFNPATREEVARQLLDRYMEQIEEK